MKQKIRIISLACVFLANSTFALPAFFVKCPATIKCDSQIGECNQPPGWILDTSQADETFPGILIINLSKIWAFKPSNNNYQFECSYNYGTHSTMTDYAIAGSLSGPNWVYSGFGKKRADCSDITTPGLCGADQVE